MYLYQHLCLYYSFPYTTDMLFEWFVPPRTTHAALDQIMLSSLSLFHIWVRPVRKYKIITSQPMLKKFNKTVVILRCNLSLSTCKNSCKSLVVPCGEGSVSTENDVPHGDGDSTVNEDREGEWRKDEEVGDTLNADSEGVPKTSRYPKRLLMTLSSISW